jgi:hypothetical protein
MASARPSRVPAFAKASLFAKQLTEVNQTQADIRVVWPKRFFAYVKRMTEKGLCLTQALLIAERDQRTPRATLGQDASLSIGRRNWPVPRSA